MIKKAKMSKCQQTKEERKKEIRWKEDCKARALMEAENILNDKKELAMAKRGLSRIKKDSEETIALTKSIKNKKSKVTRGIRNPKVKKAKRVTKKQKK